MDEDIARAGSRLLPQLAKAIEANEADLGSSRFCQDLLTDPK
jgi:hypothetical protein